MPKESVEEEYRMMIDSVGGLSPNYNSRIDKQVQKKEPSFASGDYVNISQAASRASGHDQIMNTVKTKEDPERIEKLQKIREKLENDEYDKLNHGQLDKIAKSLARAFFG